MKNKLNYELLEFHIREAAGELDSLLSRIQFMFGRLDKSGDQQVGRWGNLNEVGLEVSLEHAYHHLNFAWNVRCKETADADKHFARDEKFPRAFSRFWPKAMRRKRRQNTLHTMKKEGV